MLFVAEATGRMGVVELRGCELEDCLGRDSGVSDVG